MSTLLSIFVTVITLGTILGCFALLWWCLKDKMGVEEGKPMGHTFDGIAEINNPLPKWWSYLFIILIVVSLIYLIAYPGLGNFKGLLGWQSSNQDVRSLSDSKAATAAAREQGLAVQYDREQAKADALYGAKFRELTYEADGKTYKAIEQIANDPNALKVGQRLFLQNCAQCHGSDARGGKGFPNLTDGEWLWGGQPEQIKTTIMNGRQGIMAPWGDVLGKDGVKEAAAYVLSLSGRTVNPIQAKKGEARFATICAACHGPDGKGNPMLGAPDLTNNSWLYGSSRQTVEETITYGRHGVMPAWHEVLGEDKVHLLASYVYSLSH
ncbi:cytochrome-c oxidase, cbb3-type subunit III [Aeromonas simiae]|uniref:Cbb3-type cytochrome c oxidase subunit n=1 Tax=Aeromonas simiae TaxID=218936 RepID=A0A5J6WVD4_9GAMM|nr:cytochrome-c oxidase, cbb3-type subunit III [Aeromonas simiae]MDO2948524.1 cytochrome-c oxidase, cbb3-type subunit III [Aeromonas simiae]MDO2955907.1 cytochrome-c oxidase, cbb3-type subunit III [Aeromonas simiae]QFI54750.1 cytochrome-c oxidase, cbb3-type subunit III [Aeromonas simiae]